MVIYSGSCNVLGGGTPTPYIGVWGLAPSGIQEQLSPPEADESFGSISVSKSLHSLPYSVSFVNEQQTGNLQVFLRYAIKTRYTCRPKHVHCSLLVRTTFWVKPTSIYISPYFFFSFSCTPPLPLIWCSRPNVPEI